MHWTQPDAEAIPETDGHGDTCGIDALLGYLRLAKNMPGTQGQVDAMRADLIGLGLFDHGMTMEQIKGAANHYGVQEVKFVDFNASLNSAAFRDDIIAALSVKQYVLYETANAQALPGNQQGVQYHFVGLWGIDSDLGYYALNGDLVSDFSPWTELPQTPVWYGIGALTASQPVGYIILPALPEAPEVIIVENAPDGSITGAHDENNPNRHLGAGFALAAENAGLLNQDITTGETPVDTSHINLNVPGANTQVNVAVLGDRYLFTYDANGGVIQKDWSQAAQVIEALLRSQQTTPTIDNDSAVAAALGLVTQDAANIAMHAAHVEEFVTSLQKDIGTLNIAQTRD